MNQDKFLYFTKTVKRLGNGTVWRLANNAGITITTAKKYLAVLIEDGLVESYRIQYRATITKTVYVWCGDE